jgi:hypothetical protein
MLTHPNIDPRTIKGWKWEKMYYRRMFPGMEFFELVFPLMFPMIRIGIRFTGSVVNNAISIAAFLGFSPIFLTGCDFGWYDHAETSASNYQFKSDGSLFVSDKQTFTGDKAMVINVNGKFTDERMLNFVEGLYQIWATDDSNIIDSSGGMLEGMPKANIEDVIKNQGRGFQNILVDKNKKIEMTTKYMAWLKDFIAERRKNGFAPQD